MSEQQPVSDDAVGDSVFDRVGAAISDKASEVVETLAAMGDAVRRGASDARDES